MRMIPGGLHPIPILGSRFLSQHKKGFEKGMKRFNKAQ